MKHSVETIRDNAMEAERIRVVEHTALHAQWRDRCGERVESEILLVLRNGLVVHGTYHDSDGWAVTECDSLGNRLLLVPYASVLAVLTDSELEVTSNCRAADQRLLSYAL